MHIAYLAVSIVLLGGAKNPEPQPIPQGFYNEADCKSWKKTMEEAKSDFIDPGTSRPVLDRKFVCQPVDLDDFQKMLDRAPR